MIIATIAGIFISRAITFEPCADLRFLKLYNVSSAFAHLPEYFCSWAIFESAELDKWPSEFFMSNLHSQIFYREVPGVIPDCLCDVWCHGLTTSLLYVGLIFLGIYLVMWPVSCHITIPYFQMSYFRVWNNHFQTSTFSLSFSIDVVLILSVIAEYRHFRWCYRMYNDFSSRCRYLGHV